MELLCLLPCWLGYLSKEHDALNWHGYISKEHDELNWLGYLSKDHDELNTSWHLHNILHNLVFLIQKFIIIPVVDNCDFSLLSSKLDISF